MMIFLTWTLDYLIDFEKIKYGRVCAELGPRVAL